jgi:hypothetical protein
MNSMPPGAYSSQSMPKEKRPSGYKQYAINNYTPQQQQLHEQGFSHVGPDSYLNKIAMGDESQFAELEAPALKQFSGELGNIASRFSGLGTGGRRGSGFQNTANQAASDFSMNLQAQRQGLRRQAIMDLMGISDTLLNQRPQEKGFVEKPKKWYEEAGAGLASGVGQGFGNAAGKFFGGLF